MSHLTMTQEQLEAVQARIKAQSPGIRTHGLKRGDEIEEPVPGRGPDKRQRKSGSGRRLVFALSEHQVLRECSVILDGHPCVAFWWRQNTGGTLTMSGRYVKFSFRGCADLLGMSTAGRFIAVECKATGKQPTADQAAFLENVKAGGGLAVCCDHPGMLALALKAL